MDEKILQELARMAIGVPRVLNAKAKFYSYLKVGKQTFVGFNRPKTHPFQSTYKKNPEAIYIHAEIDAIMRANKAVKNLADKKSELYIARVKRDESNKKWVWGNACPCKGCKLAIEKFRIDKVCYTTDEGYGVWLRDKVPIYSYITI
jgi:hypothetical protein